MEIRPIQPEESGALGRITVEAYRQLFDTASLGDYEEELANVDARRLDSEVLVAVEDGVLLGGVTYVAHAHQAMSEFEDPEAAGIRMLAVDPQYQNRGLVELWSNSALAEHVPTAVSVWCCTRRP